MIQQIDVYAKLTFVVDAELDWPLNGENIRKLTERISEPLYAADDACAEEGFVQCEILAVKEEAEIYDVECEKMQYFAFGRSVADAVEVGDLDGARRHIANGDGCLYAYHGLSVTALLDAYDGWLSWIEIPQAVYLQLRR